MSQDADIRSTIKAAWLRKDTSPWKPFAVVVLVLGVFGWLRPSSSNQRARSRAVLERDGVGVVFNRDHLLSASFDLTPGFSHAKGNLGWTFQQLAQFPEVEHVSTKYFLEVNLPALRALKNLRVFEVKGQTEVGDELFETLGEMTTLQELELHGDQLTATGLKHLERLPKLKTLRLDGQRLAGDGYESLGRMPALEVLSISGLRGDAESLRINLGAAERLRVLRFENITLPMERIRGLDRLQNLEEFYVVNASIDRAMFRSLAKLPKLKTVKINAVNLPLDDVAQFVVESQALEVLHLTEAGSSLREKRNLEGAAARKLSASRSLREVALWGVPIGVEGVQTLATMSQLELLHLAAVGLDDQSIPALVKLRKFKSLMIYDLNWEGRGDGRGFSRNGWERLIKERGEATGELLRPYYGSAW